MQRVTMTIDDRQLAALDAFAARRGYTSRSEAIRDVLRQVGAHEEEISDPALPCVATLTYVYEHETRELARRLTSTQHEHHELSLSTLHLHVSAEECLEVVVLKGTQARIRAFADAVIAQRGVRYGSLHIMPIALPHEHHAP